MAKRIVESFSNYQVTGKPCLILCRNPKWSHVQWGDGSLSHYNIFCSLIERSSMNADLKRIFDENRESLSSKSELMCGCIGYFVRCPTSVAVQVFECVRTYFSKALEILETMPSSVNLLVMPGEKSTRIISEAVKRMNGVKNEESKDAGSTD